MKHDEIRRGLIDGTIHVIATEGLDKATTKQIGSTTSINEAYIYRCFKSKEDMFAQTFAFLDDELITKVMQHVELMYINEIEYKTRCQIFFNAIWRFILGNREKCSAYIQYYYSPYFRQYSAEEHRIRFEPAVQKFNNAFQEQSNVWMLLNHILSTMLDFAIKVFDGAIPDDDDTSEHVFRLIYFSIAHYFKTKESGSYEKCI